MQDLLRHFVATLAYRGTNVLEEMPDDIATLRPGPSVRTPVEILNHINGVLTYAYACLGNDPIRTELADWRTEATRFFDLLTKLDAALASHVPLQKIGDLQLLQGPFSDAMLHLGQIGIFRRLGGSPVAGEDYSIANIRIGHLKKPKELE